MAARDQDVRAALLQRVAAVLAPFLQAALDRWVQDKSPAVLSGFSFAPVLA